MPDVDPETYQLEIVVGSNETIRLSLHDLRTKFKKHEVVTTVQCAGNRRKVGRDHMFVLVLNTLRVIFMVVLNTSRAWRRGKGGGGYVQHVLIRLPTYVQYRNFSTLTLFKYPSALRTYLWLSNLTKLNSL